MNSQTAFVTTESTSNSQGSKSKFQKQQMLTVITLPDMADGSTIYAVPQDQYVVQQQDGSISIPAATAMPNIAQSTGVTSISLCNSNIREEQPTEVNVTTLAEDAKLVL